MTIQGRWFKIPRWQYYKRGILNRRPCTYFLLEMTCFFEKTDSYQITIWSLPFFIPGDSSSSRECVCKSMVGGGGANMLSWRLRDSNQAILRDTSFRVSRTLGFPWSFTVKLRSFGSWHKLGSAAADSLLRRPKTFTSRPALWGVC